MFFGRTDAKAETPILWPPHAKYFTNGSMVSGIVFVFLELSNCLSFISFLTMNKCLLYTKNLTLIPSILIISSITYGPISDYSHSPPLSYFLHQPTLGAVSAHCTTITAEQISHTSRLISLISKLHVFLLLISLLL